MGFLDKYQNKEAENEEKIVGNDGMCMGASADRL